MCRVMHLDPQQFFLEYCRETHEFVVSTGLVGQAEVYPLVREVLDRAWRERIELQRDELPICAILCIAWTRVLSRLDSGDADPVASLRRVFASMRVAGPRRSPTPPWMRTG